MVSSEEAVRDQRLRAPRTHGQALIDPSPLDLRHLLAENAARHEAAGKVWLGSRTLADLRREARHSLLQLARQHTAAYRETAQVDPLAPLIVTGHQPALYHPGVWFKNFLADHLAQGASGKAINVIVDNDIAPVPSIAVLGGSPHEPRFGRVAYDQPGPRLPWEMTHLVSRTTAERFPQQIHAQFHAFVSQPLVDRFWPDVLAALAQRKPLGEAFSQARNLLEEDLGLGVLDVPLSQLSQTEWFLHVVYALLEQADTLREIYNQAVHEYRQRHRIRSTSHPVPDLEADGPWIEAPFWIWTREQPQRRRLWVARQGKQLVLADRQGWEQTVPPQDDVATWLGQLSRTGAYLRTRALTTTLVLRLLASDVFIHGIGGAQYDQVTDVIIRRFFGIEPPRFITATATACLPVATPQVSLADVRQIERILRDAQFNPQRIPLPGEPSARQRELREEKRRLLCQVPPMPEKRQWHQRLTQLNEQLQAAQAEEIAAWQRQLHKRQQQWQQAAMLTSREFSLVLFPQDQLSDLLLDLAATTA